ncbi:30S ribosomal protein bS22 [Desulfobacula phenolica]
MYTKEVIFLGSVIKKRRKKMRKHKHRKLLAKTRHQRKKK